MFRRCGSLLGGEAPPRRAGAYLMKDRVPFPIPPMDANAPAPQRYNKVAVLIDGSQSGGVSASEYKALEATALRKGSDGVVVLRRVFHQPGTSTTSGGMTTTEEQGGLTWPSLVTSQVLFNLEPFRVDSFIPINVQLAADAQHLMEFRKQNTLKSIYLVVAKENVAAYEQLGRSLSKSAPNFSVSVLDQSGFRFRSDDVTRVK